MLEKVSTVNEMQLKMTNDFKLVHTSIEKRKLQGNKQIQPDIIKNSRSGNKGIVPNKIL